MLPESFPCVLVTWDEAYKLARKLAFAIRESGYRPDLIIAIGRGGYVPGRVVADFLLHDLLTSMKIEHWGEAAYRKEEAVVRFPLAVGVSGKKLLIVDDVTDTGDTLKTAIEYVRRDKPAEVRTAVLQHKSVSHYEPDYYADCVREWKWIIYPWAVHEDLVGFVERVLGEKASFIREIKRRLYDRFEIIAEDEDLQLALEDLVDRGSAEQLGPVYRRCSDISR